MIMIDETLPSDPIEAEVTLHVRRHLRRQIRQGGEDAASALANIFGLILDEADQIGFKAAMHKGNPIHYAAIQIAKSKEQKSGVVSLGYDQNFIQLCHGLLRDRIVKKVAFANSLATDLQTLLTFSQAIDLATAGMMNGGGLKHLVPILITGDTGTGKELLARAVHQISLTEKTSASKFHVVQVSGLTQDMINDELFGHEKGAFTGATSTRKGVLELADGGTVLIDEVGDLPPEAQLRLLRFLQDKTLCRLGSNKALKVDVRIIAATWHNLEDLVEENKFRLDLLHRLRGGWLRLPKLTERNGFFDENIVPLLETLGHTASPAITATATDALSKHTWPGNLRELVSILTVAAASATEDTVRLEDIPPHIQSAYLQIPLYKRAEAFLVDAVQQPEFSEELLQSRVHQVQASLKQLKVRVDTKEFGKALSFLKEIPDDSSDHEETISVLSNVVKAEANLQIISKHIEYWQELEREDLPYEVDAAISKQINGFRTLRKAWKTEGSAALHELDLEQSAWWSIYKDLQGLPLFKGKDITEALPIIVELLKALQSVSPILTEKLKKAAKTHGIRGVGAHLWNTLLDLEQPQVIDIGQIDDEEPEGNIRQVPFDELSAEDWLEIMSQYRSRNAAAKAIRKDWRTIKKRLSKLDLTENWTGSKQ